MASAEEPPASSEGSSNVFVPPQRQLADRISADWKWLNEAYVHTFSGSKQAFSESVSKTRSTVQAAIQSCHDMQSTVDASVTRLTEPSTTTQATKQRMLDFRRDYKQFLVAAVAVAAMAPAVLAKGRVEKARIAMRNLILGAGSTVVLCYPEAIFSLAPAFTSVQQRVQEKLVFSDRK